jgi:hypothetical protein
LFNGTVEAQDAMTEWDVYKNVLQRAWWTLPRTFLYLHLFFSKKKKIHSSKCLSLFFLQIVMVDYTSKAAASGLYFLNDCPCVGHTPLLNSHTHALSRHRIYSGTKKRQVFVAIHCTIMGAKSTAESMEDNRS